MAFTRSFCLGEQKVMNFYIIQKKNSSKRKRIQAEDTLPFTFPLQSLQLCNQGQKPAFLRDVI